MIRNTGNEKMKRNMGFPYKIQKNRDFYRREKDNLHFKSHTATKILFLVLTLALFMPMISAANWDNIKSYDTETKTVTIVNALGLGDDIAEIKLNTPLIYNVIRGNDRLVAEFTIESFEDYSNVFKDMQFYNIKDSMKEFDREFVYKYKEFYNEEVIDYKEVCEERLDVNQTIEKYDCVNNKIGSHLEERFNWIVLNEKLQLPKGIITIGIFTDVYANENVEWITEIFGERLDMWAAWTESLNVDLRGVWDFESNAEVLYGVMNLTPAQGQVSFMDSSIHGKAGRFDTDHTMNISNSATDYNWKFGVNTTLSFWFNATNTQCDIIDKGTNSWNLQNIPVNEMQVIGLTPNTMQNGTTAINVNQYIVIIRNDTNISWFHNGVLMNRKPADVDVSSSDITLGDGQLRGTADLDGMMDEIYLWNRSLTDAEAINLYDSGTGTFYEIDTTPPSVINNTPTNKTYGTTTITFNVTATDNFIVDTCLYSLNNGINNYTMTNLTADEWTDTNSSMLEGGHVVVFYCNDTLNNLNNSQSVAFNIDIDVINPEVEIAFPTNTTYTEDVVDINITFTETYPDVCWYSNDSGVTNSTGIDCTANFSAMNFGQGSKNIIVYINDTAGHQNFSNNITFYVDSISPLIDIVTPSNYTNTTYRGIDINYTYTETNVDSCWWSEDRGVTNNSLTDCSTNITSETWNEGNNTIFIYMNDTLGNENYTSVFFTLKAFTENSQSFNNYIWETASEDYKINISYTSTDWTAISASLYYNGTAYAGTKQGTGNNINFTRTIDVPTITHIGNTSFYWMLGLTNSSGINYYNSTSYQQLVNMSNLVHCNATYTTAYLNFSFKNEADLSWMTASIPTSTFLYYLGTGTTNKTLTFIDNVENSSFAFCYSPTNKNVKVDYVLQYKNSTAPQRTYNPTLQTLTNATSNITLYLLPSADGIYVTFQVINTAEQPLEDVYVNASRIIDGNTELVGEGTTGADGGITFWLSPDFLHTFTFVATGYTTYTTSITPTQSGYTINLGGIVNIADDYTRGILTYISPKANELFNDTSYTFSFNLTSSYWEIDSFGFDLRLANGSIVDSDSSVTEGTPAEVVYDVNNQTIIYMDYYYIIDGNRTESSKYWVITNTEYTSTSIKNFFTDLVTYLDSGLFGMDNFGRYLIVFIILFGSVGIMSYKYGMISPMAITSMIFAIVFFFDIVVGILPVIRGIEHVPTYLAGLMLVGTIIMEAVR